MPESNQNNSENYSTFYEEETRDMLGVPPSWITRWGSLIMISILLLVFIIIANFQYPNSTSGVINTVPKKSMQVFAITDFDLIKLFISKNSFIRKNEKIISLRANNFDTTYIAESDGYYFNPYNKFPNKLKKKDLIFVFLPQDSATLGYIKCENSYLNEIKIGQKTIIQSTKNSKNKMDGVVHNIEIDSVNNELKVYIKSQYSNHIFPYEKLTGTIVLENKKLISRFLK